MRIQDCQDALTKLSARLRPPRQAGTDRGTNEHWSTGLSDDDALNVCVKHYGTRFVLSYYQGDLSDHDGDQSSADMGLVGMLAYACGPNPEQIDRLFRASKLFRAKWDSRRKGGSYGTETIARVLASRDPRSYYNPRKQRHSRIEILSPAALKALPQPEWLIKDVLVAGTLSVLYGAPGTYKSFIALDMAYSVALGRPWQSQQVTRGDVLYIAAESVHAQTDRLVALETVHKQEITAGLDHVPRAVNLSSPQEVTALVEVIREQGKRYRLTVVDTLAQSTVGADENSSRDMGMVADVLQDLCAELDTAILVIHHTTKANGTFRGASPVRGAAVTEIKAEAAHGLVELSCLKLRHAPAFAPITLRATPVTIPNGLTPTSLVFVMTSEQMPRHGAANSPGPHTTSEIQLLAILKTINGGKRVQRAAWWRACAAQGVAETTFERARKQLLADHYITREDQGRATYYSVATTRFEDMMGDAEGEATP